jgi:type III pantothenate kinase
MIVTCDIGNTNIKAAIFNDNKLTEFHILNNVIELIDLINKIKISEIIVSSVVPTKTISLKEGLHRLNLKPIILDKNSSFNLKIEYDSRETLGIDRICSAEGALHLYCLNNEFKKDQIIISIDLGTATTLNIIKYPGIFVGGIIAPGIDLMFKSLNSETAQLPIVTGEEYKDIIGKTTNESIASGVINSAAGLIDRSIKLIQSESKAAELIIYITGGNFESIKEFLNFEYIYEKALVLYGINSIYKNSLKN